MNTILCARAPVYNTIHHLRPASA